MVEANPPEDLDDWGQENDGGEDDDWGEWDEAEVNVEFEQPDLNRQGSSYDNTVEVYSTRQRMDIKFVDKH